jgi:two-component system sensor histidine kinase CpxA
MKVSYPLSLKVSLWLMLNLLMLATLGVGFFVAQGGLGWDALVAGPAGDHARTKAELIAGELSAATAANRNAVLERFAKVYHAEFYLLRYDETFLAGNKIELPPAVHARTEPRVFRKGGGPGPRLGDFEKEFRRELPPPSGELEGPRRPEPEDFGPPRGEPGRGEPGRGDMIFDPMRERERSRFVVRAGSPASYWVGFRVPFAAERGRFRMPATLLARVDSLWGLLRYLDLQSWVLAGTGVLALSVLFWWPLVHGITRSVGQLTAATEQIAEGKFQTRVNTSRRDELGKLGESVNRMAARLDAHMTGQKRFLGDVAHELCSPLARLQMATGILSEHAPKDLHETVGDVRDEVQQMSTLVNELLAFTKAGLRPRDIACAPVELASLAEQVLSRENGAGRVTADVARDLRVMAEPELLGRALGNLVRNALRYAGDAGAITMSAAREGGRVVIAVEDHGPGVPATDLDRLGEPFFRPELARTREGGGVGLGLAIVRNSVAACGGEVRFSNREPRGFRAEIRLAAA